MIDVPACHEWAIDWPAIRRQLWADPTAYADKVPDKTLGIWQAGRCAVCGLMPRDLVRDHDHQTGLIRGKLCSSCNTLEGSSASQAFELYRQRPPTTILGLEIVYDHPLGFNPAPLAHQLEPGYEQAREDRDRAMTADLGRVMSAVPAHLLFPKPRPTRTEIRYQP